MASGWRVESSGSTLQGEEDVDDYDSDNKANNVIGKMDGHKPVPLLHWVMVQTTKNVDKGGTWYLGL